MNVETQENQEERVIQEADPIEEGNI